MLCVYTVSQCGSNTQLLHVFQEDFILGYKPHEDIPDFNITSFPTAEGTKNILLLLKYGLHSFYRILHSGYLCSRVPAPSFLREVLPGGDREGCISELSITDVASSSALGAGLCGCV